MAAFMSTSGCELLIISGLVLKCPMAVCMRVWPSICRLNNISIRNCTRMDRSWLRAWWMTSCMASAFLFMKPSTVVSSVSVAMTVSLTISATAVVVRFLLLLRHAWHVLVLSAMLLLPRCEWNERGGRFRRHLQHVRNVRHRSHNCVGDDAPQFVHASSAT